MRSNYLIYLTCLRFEMRAEKSSNLSEEKNTNILI